MSVNKEWLGLGNQTSDWVRIKSGVPRGSGLGSYILPGFHQRPPMPPKNNYKLYAGNLNIIARILSQSNIISIQVDYCCRMVSYMEPKIDKCAD